MIKQMAFAATFSLCALATGWAAADEPAKIPAMGDKAPDFTLSALDDSPITLSDVTADSPVVLVVLRGYPGYQCPICMMQVADLKKHSAELGQAKVMLVYPGPAENLGDRAGEFIKGRALPENFLFVTDPDYKFTEAYGLRWDAPRETAYPSTFVIDRQRKVRYTKVSKTHGGRPKTDDVVEALEGAK